MNTINISEVISSMLVESETDYLYHGSGMDFREFKTGKSAGTGIAHHGNGIYLVDTRETALVYVEHYAVGGRGMLYTCKLLEKDKFKAFDEQIDLGTFMDIAAYIEDIDENLSETMKEYPDMYRDETFTYGELYTLLESHDPNKIYEEYDIYGMYGGNRIHPDAVEYCVFDPELIRIVDKEEVHNGS